MNRRALLALLCTPLIVPLGKLVPKEEPPPPVRTAPCRHDWQTSRVYNPVGPQRFREEQCKRCRATRMLIDFKVKPLTFYKR